MVARLKLKGIDGRAPPGVSISFIRLCSRMLQNKDQKPTIQSNSIAGKSHL
jgi:hypothetical protein